MNDRFNELVGKQSEAESKVQIISAKIDEHKEVLKATRKEIKDYPALDPNDIDEEALRENESDRKLELTKRLGRRKKVFDEIEYKENVATKQNETAHFELATVQKVDTNITSEKRNTIKSLAKHKEDLKQQIFIKANNDKLVGRIEAEKNAAEKAHQERLKTLDENITRIEAHIEELEFITIDDPIYLRDRDRLRLINKQAAKLEKDKRDIKWRSHILYCKLNGLDDSDDETIGEASFETFSRASSAFPSRANSRR